MRIFSWLGAKPSIGTYYQAALLLLLAACGSDTTGPKDTASDDLRVRFGLRLLGDTPRPPGDVPNASRVELGRLLFFDPILSGERDVSCGTCHHPAFGFTDGRRLSIGAGGIGLGPERVTSSSAVTGEPIGLVPRNAPTVLNAAFNAGPDGRPSHLGVQFWDGRTQGLEEQARGPITSRLEMAGDAYPPEVAQDSVIARLRGIPEYVQRFREAFPSEAAVLPGSSIVTMDTYGRAVAAYERELVTRDSPFDRFVSGDDDAISPQQRQGLELFFTKARCALCHGGPMFSNYQFHVLGVPQDGPGKNVLSGDDTGREEHTGNPTDRYSFRTPTLRNVEITAPYMHDGVFATLDDVVRFYQRGAHPRHPAVTEMRVDPQVRDTIPLTDEDITAIVAFLASLTDRGSMVSPTLFQVPSMVPSGLRPVIGVRGLPPVSTSH